MKTIYENELRSLQNWINNVNNGLATGAPIIINPTSADNICYLINVVANEIEEEYPIYAVELKNISANLFKNSAYGSVTLNSAAFGELFIIIHHIIKEPIDMSIW